MFDLEMIKQIGYCHGIENYSRHFSGRLPGEAPPTLLDYLPHDALMFIDESHQTMPQLQGMYHGDRRAKRCWSTTASGCRARKIIVRSLLRSSRTACNQVIYVSATPGPYELTKSAGVSGRTDHSTTGLVDPEIEVRPIKGQVDDLLNEIRLANGTDRTGSGDHADQTHVRGSCGILRGSRREVRVSALGGSTLDRVKILRDLRRGAFDVLIGVNPAARRARSAGGFSGCDAGRRQRRISALHRILIQTIGRAARN